MDIEDIKTQVARLEGWLGEHAPMIDEEQRHLDDGTEARRYWHYGRLIALKDVLRQLDN